MLSPVAGEGICQEALGPLGIQVGLAIFLGDLSRSTPDDDPVAALVEDLGDAGVQRGPIERVVEADPHVAGGIGGGIARDAPGGAAGLVVERGVQIPSARGLVLGLAQPLGVTLLPSPLRRVVSRREDELDRSPQWHRPRLEEIVEVETPRTRLAVLALAALTTLVLGDRTASLWYNRMFPLLNGLQLAQRDRAECDVDLRFPGQEAQLLQE